MRSFDVAERRARLVRRHHLAPGHRAADVLAASDGVVGLHATDPATVYLAARARVDDLTVADVDKALYADRSLVKHLCMRRTLFVFRRDLLGVTVAAASTRVAEQERRRVAKAVEKAGLVDDGAAWLRAAEAATLAALDVMGEASSTELREAVDLLEGSIEYAPHKAYGGKVPVGPRVLTCLSAAGEILRASNRGGWNVSRPAWARTSTWLGEEPEVVPEREARAELVRRWLHTFGPGTVADVKWWLGSTVAAVRTALADIGAVEVDLHGAPGVALADDLDPVESPEPSAALLPALDPTTMGWFEREWYLGPHRPEIFDSTGNGGTTAWCDGRIVGGWYQGPDGAVLLQLLEDVGADAIAALEREAARLTAWVDGVRVAPRFPSPLSRRATCGGPAVGAGSPATRPPGVPSRRPSSTGSTATSPPSPPWRRPVICGPTSTPSTRRRRSWPTSTASASRGPHRGWRLDGRLAPPRRGRRPRPARPGTVPRMIDTRATDDLGALFHRAGTWADMTAWHAQVAHIRRTDPVLRVDAAGFAPFWVLTRHADVLAVSRDNTRWLNTPRSVLGPDEDWERLLASGMPQPASLVHLDGAKHRAHRAVTNDWFKPAAVRHRQPRIDELADLFVGRMRDLGGRCDFAQDIAQPYTLRVIMDIYGVPEEDEPLMMDLTQGIFGAADPEYLGDAGDPGERMTASVMQFIQYFNELTTDRRARPADDLATVIAHGEVDGAPMGDIERLWYYIIVATAGHDTTSFALAGGMEQLARTPEQLFGLAGDDEAVVTAAEEILRWTSPVRHFMRYATEAMTVGGVDVPEGGRVLLSYPAANRDEAVFADPMTFDVRRSDADRQVGFGGGAHFCLGAQFARRELRTMLHLLSRELTHVELAGEPEWALSHFVSGVKHLPIAYAMR